MRLAIPAAALALALAGCQADRPPAADSSSKPDPQAAPAPLQAQEFAPTPYDAGATRLPEFYGGVTGTRFFDLLLEKVDASAKDPYETTAQFKARTADVDRIIAPLSTKAEYLFLLEGASARYDADRASYGIDRSCDAMYGDDNGSQGLACQVESTLRTGGLYGYTQRYIELLMTRQDARAIGLRKGRYSAHEHTYRCPVDQDKARSLSDAEVTIALVGRVKSAELYRATTSFDNWDTPAGRRDVGVEFIGVPFSPTRWVCFARKTGEILHTQAIQQ